MSWIQWVAFQQAQTRKANDTELTDRHWSHKPSITQVVPTEASPQSVFLAEQPSDWQEQGGREFPGR